MPGAHGSMRQTGFPDGSCGAPQWDSCLIPADRLGSILLCCPFFIAEVNVPLRAV